MVNILGLLHANSVGNWRAGLRTALDLMLKCQTRVLVVLLTASDLLEEKTSLECEMEVD